MAEYSEDDVSPQEIDDWLTHLWTKWVMVKSSNLRSENKSRPDFRKSTSDKQGGAMDKKSQDKVDRAIHVVKQPGIGKKRDEVGGMNPLIRETLKGWITGGRVSLKELMRFVVDEMDEIEGGKEK